MLKLRLHGWLDAMVGVSLCADVVIIIIVTEAGVSKVYESRASFSQASSWLAYRSTTKAEEGSQFEVD